LGKTPPISRLQNTSRHLSERKEWILNQSVECVDKGVHFTYSDTLAIVIVARIILKDLRIWEI